MTILTISSPPIPSPFSCLLAFATHADEILETELESF